MYYVLFNYKKGRMERDFRGFRTEDEALSFLVLKGKDIHVHEVIEALGALKLGFINDPFFEKKGEVKDEVKGERIFIDDISRDEEILRKNKEALADLEAEEEPTAPEEEEVHDLPPTEEEKEEEVQEVLDKADETIKNAEEMMDRKCSVCGVKTILVRNKTGVCTPCQLKPKKGKKKPGPRKAKF